MGFGSWEVQAKRVFVIFGVFLAHTVFSGVRGLLAKASRTRVRGNYRGLAPPSRALAFPHKGGPPKRGRSVSKKQPVFSARIRIDYRALGLMEADIVTWFWIGSHADYDKLLN